MAAIDGADEAVLLLTLFRKKKNFWGKKKGAKERGRCEFICSLSGQ